VNLADSLALLFHFLSIPPAVFAVTVWIARYFAILPPSPRSLSRRKHRGQVFFFRLFSPIGNSPVPILLKSIRRNAFPASSSLTAHDGTRSTKCHILLFPLFFFPSYRNCPLFLSLQTSSAEIASTGSSACFVSRCSESRAS